MTTGLVELHEALLLKCAKLNIGTRALARRRANRRTTEMSRELHGLKVGARVQAAERINLMPHAIIDTGETGVVVGTVSEGDIEGVEVLWDKTHKGLCYWGNKTLLVDPEIEALFPTITKVLREMQPSVDMCVLSEVAMRAAGWRGRVLALNYAPVVVLIKWLLLGVVVAAEAVDMWF